MIKVTISKFCETERRIFAVSKLIHKNWIKKCMFRAYPVTFLFKLWVVQQELYPLN